MTSWVWILTSLGLLTLCSARSPHPHIVYIIADDLGWNDVGFHGSNQIPTPNIDALAYDGVILNNYYVSALCTPSRSALMTGRHPIHTGMQHSVLIAAEARGLPLNETLLPQHLKALGYSTHMVGKWHLGMYKREYTPTMRGFDSHLGFWTARHDYFDHTSVEVPYWGLGLDMRRGMEPAWDLHGQYSTDIFTREAVSIITTHNSSTPLFLYLAHAAVHRGNDYNPLPVHDNDVRKITNIEDYSRRKFAAMVTKLDESVGKVVKALCDAKMLQDSIIVFTTDNGGPVAGFRENAASNWPLKGIKATLWEGGVRGVGVIWSPMIKTPRRVASQLMHITDWMPTLYAAAGGDTKDLGAIDGMSCWQALSENITSDRSEVLHNIDDIVGIGAITVDEWKLVKGGIFGGKWDGWYGPSGRDPEYIYDLDLVFNSSASQALASLSGLPSLDDVEALRDAATVQCSTPDDNDLLKNSTECRSLESPCLFNIVADPCELYNLADRYPDVLQSLEEMLQQWNATAVLPSNLPIDPRANPANWNHTWHNFGDESELKTNVN